MPEFFTKKWQFNPGVKISLRLQLLNVTKKLRKSVCLCASVCGAGVKERERESDKLRLGQVDTGISRGRENSYVRVCVHGVGCACVGVRESL